MNSGADITGLRVTVVGLGRFGGGVGVTRWLAGMGAKVTVSDKAPADDLGTRIDLLAEELADYQVRLTLGRISEFEVSLAGVEEEIEGLYLGGEDEAPPEWELWGESL